MLILIPMLIQGCGGVGWGGGVGGGLIEKESGCLLEFFLNAPTRFLQDTRSIKGTIIFTLSEHRNELITRI